MGGSRNTTRDKMCAETGIKMTTKLRHSWEEFYPNWSRCVYCGLVRESLGKITLANGQIIRKQKYVSSDGRETLAGYRATKFTCTRSNHEQATDD